MLNSGEGGFLLTNDEDLAAKMILYAGAYEKLYQKHLTRPADEYFEKYKLETPNYSMRMDAARAAMILPQDLRDTGLGPEGVLRVAPARAECGALTILDLSDIAIADAGAETLAMHLPQNEALERLWLRGNKVGGLEAAAMAGRG